MPEFRKDPVIDRWVIIATQRAKRPQRGAGQNETAGTEPCPFCAGNEAMTPPPVLTYKADSPDFHVAAWSLRVVPNRYPALVDEGTWTEQPYSIYKTMKGLGVHEVIIEAPEHVVNMGTLDEKRLEQVFHAYRDRIIQLQKDQRWRSILIYKNHGAEAGATLDHIHSQLIALPTVPKAIEEEVDGAKKYHDAHGSCIYCAMIDQEIGDQNRIVAESDRFIVFCPYASRFPYETWILPKQHAPCFELALKDDYADLARSLRGLLIRLNRRFEDPPFNYFIHTNSWDEAANAYYHWHMELLPKLSQAAGFEWGSGAYINSVAPEEAARHLRDVRF